jgi:anti-sigma regulatory factor (Ser/Thr protein kinase)
MRDMMGAMSVAASVAEQTPARTPVRGARGGADDRPRRRLKPLERIDQPEVLDRPEKPDEAGAIGAIGATGQTAETAGTGRPGSAVDLTHEPWMGEVSLDSRPESACAARRLTRHQLQTRWLLSPQLTDDAVLLVSELVGNAVTHAGAHAFGLRIRRRRGRVRIEVRDPSRALPCHLPVRELDVSGRGLWLVDKLADRWGVDLLPHGKSTWFELRLTRV